MNALLNNIFEQPEQLQIVLNTLYEKDREIVEQIADELEKASEIILTSMGSAYYSLMPMYYLLVRKGLNVKLIESSELLLAKERLSTDKLYLFMSRSGESCEVAALSGLLKEKGAKTVSITMTPESTMAKNTSIVLFDCCSYDNLVCTKAYSSLALCGLLCVAAMDGSFTKELADKLTDMFSVMEEKKESILKEMEALTFLKEADSFIFLSRGYGMGTIESGSLWLEEESKKCADVMSIDNFYHGPIEIISANTIPIYLDVLGDERTEMIWSCICKNAEHSIYIGPAEKKPEACSVISCPKFEIEEEYNMIMQAVYFQLLAYQTARFAGVEPGEFQILNDWVIK